MLTSEERKFLVFKLAGMLCAFPIESVGEIVPLPLLSSPPGRPSMLEGFFNLDGTATPAIRLDRLFNLPEQPPGLYTPLVILKTEQGRTAFIVSEIASIVSVPLTALLPVNREQSFNDCVHAQIALGESTAHLLDPKRILLEQERRKIAEFRIVEQQRLDDLEESR